MSTQIKNMRTTSILRQSSYLVDVAKQKGNSFGQAKPINQQRELSFKPGCAKNNNLDSPYSFCRMDSELDETADSLRHHLQGMSIGDSDRKQINKLMHNAKGTAQDTTPDRSGSTKGDREDASDPSVLDAAATESEDEPGVDEKNTAYAASTVKGNISSEGIRNNTPNKAKSPKAEQNEKRGSSFTQPVSGGLGGKACKQTVGSCGHRPHNLSKSAFYKEAKENVLNSNNTRGTSSTRGVGSPQPGSSIFRSPNKKPPTAGKKKYTKEQVAFAEEVLEASETGTDSHYRVLGLSVNATQAEIKSKFRKLALKLHPDKNRAPNADEAFKAASSAYDILKSPTSRANYDRNNPSYQPFIPRHHARSAARHHSNAPSWTKAAPSSAKKYAPGSSPYNTIPSKTHITIQGLTSTTHLNGVKGSVQSFNTSTTKYSVLVKSNWIASHGVVEISPACLFQNVTVRLRDLALVRKLGSHLAQIISYGQAQGTYQVSFIRDGKQAIHGLHSADFVFFTDTIVRLEGLRRKPEQNGSYGKVVNWEERFESNGNDTSYYEVQMSQSVIVQVKMANVYL